MFLRQRKQPKDQDTNVKIVDGRESRLVDPPGLQPPATAFRLLTASSAYPNFATGLEKNKSVTHVRGMTKFVVRTSLRRPARPSSTLDTSPLGPTQLRRCRARLGSFRSSQFRLQTMAPSTHSSYHHQATMACQWVGVSVQDMSAQ